MEALSAEDVSLQATTTCETTKADDLKPRRIESQARCDALVRSIGGVTFDLTEPCSALLQAGVPVSTPAKLEITVGTQGRVTVDLHEELRALSPSAAPQRGEREPAALLSVGGVSWDLSPYLAWCLLTGTDVEVGLTIGNQVGRLSMGRSMALSSPASQSLCMALWVDASRSTEATSRSC